jgi:hypothetical protein
MASVCWGNESSGCGFGLRIKARSFSVDRISSGAAKASLLTIIVGQQNKGMIE